MLAPAGLLLLNAHDSNYHVGSVNKIPHFNDFTYLQYYCCRQKDFKPFRCLFDVIPWPWP